MCWVGDPRNSANPYWRSEAHLLVAEGDYVVERFTASGTHRGVHGRRAHEPDGGHAQEISMCSGSSSSSA
jgi:hypothetical protein